MSFNSNVAPVRRVKDRVEREPWACRCLAAGNSGTLVGRGGEAEVRFCKTNHPGLKRCGTCGEARPETRQLEKADYPALLHT